MRITVCLHGATVREVQQRILKTAELTRMYLDKLAPGRLTCVKVPPPKEKGGHTKVIYRLPEQWISMGDPVTLAPPRGVKAKAAHPQIP